MMLRCLNMLFLKSERFIFIDFLFQELIAYGAGNIFGSFFSCYPYAASVSRSSVQESAGGRTQVQNMIFFSPVITSDFLRKDLSTFTK